MYFSAMDESSLSMERVEVKVLKLMSGDICIVLRQHLRPHPYYVIGYHFNTNLYHIHLIT